MNKLIKAGILIVLLGIPVLLYIFLKTYGVNHYDLKFYFPIENEDGSIKISNGDTAFRRVSDFHFKDQLGNDVSQKNFEGKIYVADFIFTTCGTICPKMTYQMGRVQEMFKNNHDVKIISHTVDPESDSISVLADYAKRNKAIYGKWYFVTGNKKELYDMGQLQYSVSTMQDVTLPIEDQFIHSDKFILVDKDKHIRGIYDGTDPKEVDRLIVEIKILLHGYELKKTE
jgi:protein SCO1/2